MLVFENTNDEATVFEKRNDVITHRPEFSNLSRALRTELKRAWDSQHIRGSSTAGCVYRGAPVIASVRLYINGASGTIIWCHAHEWDRGFSGITCRGEVTVHVERG